MYSQTEIDEIVRKSVNLLLGRTMSSECITPKLHVTAGGACSKSLDLIEPTKQCCSVCPVHL